jgi:hypothetical protein
MPEPRPGTRLLRIAVIVIVVVAVGWTVTSPVSVRAAGSCSTTGNWFAGWWSSPTLTGNQPEGANANLTYRTAGSCVGIGTRDASYSGWVMIAGNNQLNRYAQAGFWFDGNPFGCMRHFSEWDDGYGYHRLTGSCVGDGEVHTPKVAFVPSTWGTQMWIDNTLFDTMVACSCFWNKPLEVQYFGEVHDQNGDVPGYSATKTDWSGMQIQYYSNDTWHGTCSTITLYRYVSQSRFGADAPACNHVRSWTA